MNTQTTLHEAHAPTLNRTRTTPCILVADDDANLRELHEVVLGSAGYLAYGAADGEEALAMLRSGQFDLLVTDCKMPRLDGFGLVRQMRAEGIEIPVVMFSGSYAESEELPDDVRNEIAVVLGKGSGSLRLMTEAGRALKMHRTTPTAAAA